MDLKPNDFIDNLVDFSVCKMKSAKTLWINQQVFSPNEKLTKQSFTEKFAFGILGNDCFDNINFDQETLKTYQAERYGGVGIGRHGGGVRCGNYGKYQIKGIGRNPLADNNTEAWHSYGGLNLIDAMYETINSVVLQKIMPLGVATCYGLIITGDDSAYLPGKIGEIRGYGALMIREACLRPAHFIRAPFFKLNSTQKHFLLKDSARVRQVNKQLAVKFQQTNSFIAQFGRILANFANQFAFARAARIIHGSISTSNLCLDGRWLDLTNASFIASGINAGGSCSFYEEPIKILNVIEEFIYTYAKYNQIQLNPQPLFKYYIEQFDAYFKFHVSYILGLNFDYIEGGLNNNDYLFITKIFDQVITSAKDISFERSIKLKNDDPIVSLLEGLFLSIVDTNWAQKKLAIALPNEEEKVNKLLEIFPKFLYSAYKKSSNSEPYFSFLQTAVIIALKRSLIPEYFFMGRLELYIYNLVTQNKKDQFEQVINDSTNIANWAFDKEVTTNNSSSKKNNQRNISLFESTAINIYFCPHHGQYLINYNGLSTQFFSYQNSLKYIHKLPTEMFTLSEYNFLDYLNRLGSLLCILESNNIVTIKNKEKLEVII